MIKWDSGCYLFICLHINYFVFNIICNISDISLGVDIKIFQNIIF